MTSLERVRLADIDQLVLYSNQQTLSRRNELYPQVICEGNYCDFIRPTQAVCDKMGQAHDGDLDWSCSMDLPENLKLSETRVSCEGWDGAGDPFIVEGSCSVRFSLTHMRDKLQKGETDSQSAEEHFAQRRKDRIITTVFLIFFAIIFIGLAYSFIRSFLRQQFPQWRALPPVQRLWGGNEDDDDDPGHGWHSGGGGGGAGPGDPFDSDKTARFGLGSAAASGAAYGARRRLQQHELMSEGAGPSRTTTTRESFGEVRASTGIGRSSVR